MNRLIKITCSMCEYDDEFEIDDSGEENFLECKLCGNDFIAIINDDGVVEVY